MEALDKVTDKILQGRTMKAVKEGWVLLGGMELNCAVLDDGQETTVFSLRTFESVIGIAKQSGGKTVGEFLPSFIRPSTVKPYIDKHLPLSNFSLISFTLKRGGKAYGITVEQIDKVMQGWIDAYNAGALTESQENVAYRMQAMKNAASISGFTQVIHEQLGYIDIRQKTITEIFDRIFEREYHRWAHQFGIEYYENIYRLKEKTEDWTKLLATVKPGGKPQTPSWLGSVTNDIVYSRLKPFGILDILKKKNPYLPDTGRRKRRHHQYLTKEEGLKKLNTHLGEVTMLMRMCTTWEEFHKKLNEFHPVQDGQARFDFMDKHP